VEQVELLKVICHTLPRRDSFKVVAWQIQNLDDPLPRPPTKLVHSLAELAADCWPTEESADDIIEYLYQQRREDRWF
jgi:hypothetical protein